MIQYEIYDRHTKQYKAWYEKYPEVYLSEVAAIKEQLLKLPENIRGIEIGVGTGRFAKALGIKEGVEPAKQMVAIAIKRGIEVVKGTAENLPHKDLYFDFVLFVTVCCLDNFKEALKEAHRVLKPKGSIIIGFIDKNQSVGKAYEAKRKQSTFFRYATFYSVKRINKMLKDAGFINAEYNQTLFGNLELISEVQQPQQGYGEGSFLVVKATKK